MSKKIVVITGASSGIGASTAKLLAQNGNSVVLGARREDRLQKITSEIEQKGGSAIYRICDVTDLAQVQALAQAAIDKFHRIDVWINNAGLMPCSELSKGRVDEWNQMIDVNLKGTLYGIDAVLPIMRQQQAGQIINIASVAGHRVSIGSSVYSATKAAVLALSESLRQEEAQAKSNIRITVISPGAIATELTDHVKDPQTKQQLDKFYENYAISADRVAQSINFAIDAPADTTLNEIIIRPTSQL